MTERYRFHGSVPPPKGRQPLAFLASPKSDEEGVATVRLYDPIDSWGGDWGVSAKEFAALLDETPDDVSEIRLHINSPGGEVFEGLAILNQLRQHRAKITTVVDGLAASIASVIAMAGDEVLMAPNSELMIHDAWGLAIGNAADMQSMAKTLDHLSDNIASVYADRAGGTAEDWRALMRLETWFGADEAVEAGLANALAETPAKVDAKAAFDLSQFRFAGRAEAPDPHVPVPVASATEEDNRRLRHRMKAQRLHLPRPA